MEYLANDASIFIRPGLVTGSDDDEIHECSEIDDEDEDENGDDVEDDGDRDEDEDTLLTEP